jgi:hypothetical protein
MNLNSIVKDIADNQLEELASLLRDEQVRRYECRPVSVLVCGMPQMSGATMSTPQFPALSGDGITYEIRPADHPQNVRLKCSYTGHFNLFVDVDHPDLVIVKVGRNPAGYMLRSQVVEIGGEFVSKLYARLDGYGKLFNTQADTHVCCDDDTYWPVGECTEHVVYDDDDDDVCHEFYTHNVTPFHSL